MGLSVKDGMRFGDLIGSNLFTCTSFMVQSSDKKKPNTKNHTLNKNNRFNATAFMCTCIYQYFSDEFLMCGI
jgi:hypothetical protein